MRHLASFLLALVFAAPTLAQELPTIESKTEGLSQRDGFFTLYWDDDQGKVWLEVDTLEADFLYGVSLARGLGSNDIGLDRNQLGGSRVVRFERVGRKLLLVTPNLDFRADSDNAQERASVDEAFAEGIVWSFRVEARTGDRFLVDATDFVTHDAHGVIGRLRSSGQGTFRVDAGRSAPNPDVLKSFPDNTEMEGRITFTSESPGGWVRSVAADPTAVTLNVRHSFIRLPDDGYKPRAFDPRSGYYGSGYMDYASPIGENMTKRFINRHRLEKKDPDAPMSEAVEPIVYYLDNGTPEPVRSALLDGARWWNQAFQAAGFINAFQVEVLPDDADPLDVRYNMINWVHRSTRGWSYGSSVTDPRTGEIIKGHVLLGSLRVRQDYLLMEGLMAPYGGENPPSNPDPMLEVALARIRQLSAHEVGHTLGIAHNFAASAVNRASVMDYPAPLVVTDSDGNLVFDHAYDTDIGEWDVVTVKYGYEVFPDSVDEASALNAILDEAYNDGLRYITDSDARPRGAAHPLANLWDNGADPVEMLRIEMAVRKTGLDNFGLATIRQGRPLTTLHEALVPLYLRHRYQIDAVAKMLGGAVYTYALRGDMRQLPTPVPPSQQMEALQALLQTVTPDALSLPAAFRNRIPPRTPGFGNNRELFDSYADPLFDPYAPAEVAATMVFDQLLAPERMARMMYQEDQDETMPSISDVVAMTSETVWNSRVPRDPYQAEIQRLSQTVWTDALIEAAANRRAQPGVRARIWQHLQDLAAWLADNPGDEFEDIAHRGYTLAELDRFLLREYQAGESPQRTTTPPGSPIGAASATSEDPIARQSARRNWLEGWAGGAEYCDW